MKAIVITRPGPPEVLQLAERPMPEPARGEVRVRVRATAINRADLLQRLGAYPAPPDSPADIPGLEYAGEIDVVGPGVTQFSPGDRVFGLAGGGAYATHLVVHAATVARLPDALSFSLGAAVPEAFITAYDAMVTQAGLAAGDTVLISAVGSGVGTAAVQIARAIGARSIGTSRTADKLERARALGMDEGIHIGGAGFASEVLRLTAGRGVEVVLELVGGSYVAEDLLCMATRGCLMMVGLMSRRAGEIDFALLLRQRLRIQGTALRSRALDEKIALARILDRHLGPLLERGLLRPVIGRSFPLVDAADGHAYMETNQGFGKVILEVGV